MQISVVIPAINEARNIQRAISSCWEAGFDQVILSDGGSVDGTPELARQMDAKVVLGARGRAAQQNLGAQHATGHVLLFLHADNWLDTEAGNQIRNYLTDSSMQAGAFLQRIEATGFAYRIIEWGNAFRVRRLGMAYGDQAIFMRRETFEQMGGFPQVQLMEDLLLMRAFRKVGHVGLLDGPVHVSARRWEKHGIFKQTLRNWALVLARKFGVSLYQLKQYYPSHSNLEEAVDKVELEPKQTHVPTNERHTQPDDPPVVPSVDQ